MKTLFSIVILIFLISCESIVKEDGVEMPCWISGDMSNIITSQLAMLKTYLLPIDLYNPKIDAEKRLHHKDYRLIAIGGLGIEFPALDLYEEGDILCKLGWRYIEGTSDVYESEEHVHFMNSFYEYAKIYNSIILNHHKNSKND